MRDASLRTQHRRHSLRARLLGLVALSTALVVGATTYLQKHIIVEAVESEALDTAVATAVGVAAELTDRGGIPSAAELEEMLADFARAIPALRALTVTRLEPDGTVSISASTEAQPPEGVRALARAAIGTRDRAVSDALPGPLRLVAVPLERDREPYGAVVVAISTAAVERVLSQIRVTALLATPVAILLLTAILHALTRDLVLAPIGAILSTMRQASGGDLQARVPSVRRDEIGNVAEGLNEMLERVADFNATLQREVKRATETLEERNRQLADGAQHLFAARRDLARSEQLAVAGQMAASVAHQIGTPLNLISGYVQMIQQDLPPRSVAAGRLLTVEEQIGRVATIVQGLLDQARRPILHRAEVPAADLVRRVCELAGPTLQRAAIALRLNLGGDLPVLYVDTGQIEQVFLNIVTNSVDAMPEGGELRVGACVQGDAVEFSFGDTGAGINAENLARIFDPLFTTKEPGKGTGLGLTIARDVVGAHGGTLTVSSQAGSGTAVVVRLPHHRAGESHA